MSTYKALVKSSPSSPLVLQTLPLPTSPPPPGTIYIHPLYTNLTSYARAAANNAYSYPVSYPFVPGHCCVARVSAVPADAVSLKPGDLVWVDSVVTARDDPSAQFLLGFFGGASNAAQGLMRDVWRDGCFAEHVAVPLENCFVLPGELFEGGRGHAVRDMAALSFLLVGYAGLEEAGVGAGTTVIVAPATGKYSGGAVLVALAMGAKVVAASRSAEKLKLLEQFPGAVERLFTVELKGSVDADAAALLAATGGKGAHVFMDVSPPAASGPDTPTHFTAALRALRRNARVVLSGGIQSDISFNYIEAMIRNLTVKGKFMYEREHVQRMIEMIENGNLVLGERAGLTVKGVFGLRDFEKALEVEGTSEWWGEDVLLAPCANK